MNERISQHMHPLGTCLRLNYGKTLAKADRDESGGFPVWGSGGVFGKHTSALVNEPCILVGRKGSVGSVRIAHEPCWVIDTAYWTVPSEGSDIRYVAYLLESMHLERLDSSTAIPGIRRDEVESEVVYLPSLLEQRRIAAKIDELVSDVDAGQRALASVLQALPAAHASLLDVAFSGLLTNEIPDPSTGIPVGWRWATVGDKSLSDVEAGLTKNDTKRKDLPLQVPYLRVANVQENELVLDEIKKIAVTAEEARKKSLEKGDLLVVEGNGSRDQIGRVAVWDGSIPLCVHQNHIIRVRFSGSVNPRFALYWLMSARGRNAVVERASTTSGLYTLSKSKVESLPLPVAGRDTQDRIVGLIDEEVSRLNALETYAKAAAGGAVSLRQSILAAAFSGQLT